MTFNFRIFTQSLSPTVAAVLMAAAVFALVLGGNAWGVFAGLRLWGDWFNQLIGLSSLLGISDNLPSPISHRISLMVIATFSGAVMAALFAGQFRLTAASAGDYVRSIYGGLLMGLGASLAGGCTIGGFYMPAALSAPTAISMWCGLLLGSLLGIRWLLHDSYQRIDRRYHSSVQQWTVPFISQRFFALLLVAVMTLWVISWGLSDNVQQQTRLPLLAFGLFVGWVMQRSRFCIASAIREPFLTGDMQMAKAVLWFIVLSVVLVTLSLPFSQFDPYWFIPARFWLGSLIGGVLFGIGMILAGGCATGLLWRSAEGGIKIWLALFFFAWGGSVFSALLRQWGMTQESMSVALVKISPLGKQVFLPDLLNQPLLALAVMAAWLLCWYGLIVLIRYKGWRLLR